MELNDKLLILYGAACPSIIRFVFKTVFLSIKLLNLESIIEKGLESEPF